MNFYTWSSILLVVVLGALGAAIEYLYSKEWNSIYLYYMAIYSLMAWIFFTIIFV